MGGVALPVWLLAAAAACLGYAAGRCLPGCSPASRLVRRHGAPQTPWQRAAGAAAQRLGRTGAALRRLWLRPALDRAYPDLLAHLALQTAAGASLVEALASAPAAVPPPLRQELALLATDLAVAPLPAALNRWAERVGTPWAAALARVLAQHHTAGFPLAAALAREEVHCLSLQRQEARRRVQAAAATLAGAMALLLLNAVLLYLVPVFAALAAGRRL